MEGQQLNWSPSIERHCRQVTVIAAVRVTRPDAEHLDRTRGACAQHMTSRVQ
jgi:hypothetical protein